jgi:dephospho-CoA kinase
MMGLTLAVTGGIASGKSTVGALLAERGVPVVDTDAVVHNLYADDRALQEALVAAFGPAVVQPDAQGRPVVCRAELGRVVFQSAAAKVTLEGLVHPRVRARVAEFGAANAAAPVVAVQIPQLFETGTQGAYDAVWLLGVPEAVQVARLVASRGLSPEVARQRVAAQMPLTEKRRLLAEHPRGAYWENTAPLAALRVWVDEQLAALCEGTVKPM